MRPSLITAAMATALLTHTATAGAQAPPAESFEQLQVLIGTGETVTVTDAAGRRATGRMVGLSNSTLILDIGTERRAFEESDVRIVGQRRGDPLGNGAWWGFGVGSGIGAIGFASLIADGEIYQLALLTIPAYGAMGAGIGVAIDALIKREKTIYGTRPHRATLSVSPMIGKTKGLAVAMRF